MKKFKNFLQEQELLDEAGNISSSIAIRKHNDVIRYSKDALRSRSIDEKLDNLSKAIVAHASLTMISVAVSGDKSFMSKVATGLSFRGI